MGQPCTARARPSAPGHAVVRMLAHAAAGARGAQALGRAAGALVSAQHLRHADHRVRQAVRRTQACGGARARCLQPYNPIDFITTLTSRACWAGALALVWHFLGAPPRQQPARRPPPRSRVPFCQTYGIRLLARQLVAGCAFPRQQNLRNCRQCCAGRRPSKCQTCQTQPGGSLGKTAFSASGHVRLPAALGGPWPGSAARQAGCGRDRSARG